MKNFVLVNICDEKKLRKHQKDRSLKQSVILPYYGEKYVCFSSCKDYFFEELIKMFLQGNDDEQIGAISIIAEKYPRDLYWLIRNQRNYFSPKKLKFIFDFVLPDYLPLVLPKEQLIDYEFNKEYSNDIWVNILMEIRCLL